MNKVSRGFAFASLIVATGACAAPAADLKPVEDVLARVATRKAALKVELSSEARLLRDINAFRAASPPYSPEQAATAWLSLWDRAAAVDPLKAAASYEAFDVRQKAAVDLRSVMSALPDPAAWPAIRKQATARAASKPGDASALGLRMLSELLVGDAAAAKLSLSEFERLAASGNPAERNGKLSAIDRARTLVYKLYGSRDDIAEGFRASVDVQARQAYGYLDAPDLVSLVGPEKAAVLLDNALKKPILLEVPRGAATRALARKIALKEIAALRKPQWGLVDDLGTSALYEAMQKRFDPSAAKKGRSADEAAQEFDYQRQSADAYYFLDLIVAGRRDEAERVMERASSKGWEPSVPKRAMAELVRAGKGEAVYLYLAQLLERRPELQAWDLYLEQAGSLGHANDAIALLDRLQKRRDLSPFLQARLQDRRLDALLGADQVGEAVTGLKAQLADAPSLDDPRIGERARAALRLAGLGRVLNQPELAQAGFGYAVQAVALPVNTKNKWRAGVLKDLQAELRRQDRVAQAQALALAELEREGTVPGLESWEPIVGNPARRAALVELAGLYDRAQRHGDVLRMLDDMSLWGASDLQALIAEKDSLGTPLGMMAARALQAAGKDAATRAAVLGLLDQMPGYDPAYALLVAQGPGQALDELDRRYAHDPFEERPLIWKASALNTAHQYDAAEATIRRAIAIDPSDGEQGPGDRMRAYAVLADVLEAQGREAKAVQLYRNAVGAIRLSEHADELRKLGLYQRASVEYRAALDQFSDAYCIQSRLAVQLGRIGLNDEALKHYRRAFELMPDSFGRVESHCFGCESVFDSPQAQDVAEQVFASLMRRTPPKPQAPYMLAYLRMEQGRYDEAVALFQQAIALDGDYLNAWKHLHDLGDKTYIPAEQRDQARLRLYALDPRQLHVRYSLDEVADIAALWRATAAQEAALASQISPAAVYPLSASAREKDIAMARLPADMRKNLDLYLAVQDAMKSQGMRNGGVPNLGEHKLFRATLNLMGVNIKGDDYE